MYEWQPVFIKASYLIRINMEIKTRVKQTVTADLTITEVFDPASRQQKSQCIRTLDCLPTLHIHTHTFYTFKPVVYNSYNCKSVNKFST